MQLRHWIMSSPVAIVAMPFLLAGCSSSTRTTVVETWEDRPRFFTAYPGEEHSTFAKVVWYDRPRFFTKAEGESQSNFEQIVEGRPRVFTTRSEPVQTYSTTYPATTHYRSSNYETETVPVQTQPVYREGMYEYPETKPMDSDTHKVKVQETIEPSRPSDSDSRSDLGTLPTYGADTHRNVTALSPRSAEPTSPPAARDTRAMLTGDAGTRPFDEQISNWPQASREAAQAMHEKYGAPDSTTSEKLTWRDRDPFAEIVVFKNGTSHDYPDNHQDVLAHSIYYQVNASRLDELNDFRGNIKADHNRGFLTAKCRSEAMNILSLNLAHQILTDQRSLANANKDLMQLAGAKVDSAMTHDLQFEIGEETDNPDADEQKNIDDMDADVESDPDLDKDKYVDEP